MADQNAKQLHSMKARLIVQATRHHVQHFKAGQTHFFKRNQISNKGDEEEPFEMAQTFTTDLVMTAIKNCINSKAFGPNRLCICYLKHLGPRAIEYITSHFNLSVAKWLIAVIWKSSLIIPIPKPGKDTSQ